MHRIPQLGLLVAFVIFSSGLIGQTAHAEEPPSPRLRLVDAVQLDDFASGDGSDGLDLRGAVISPSGSLMASHSGDRFCIYSFVAQTQDCTPKPEDLARLAPRLAWSPDSRMIAMHEDFFVRLFEPDIWLFDVETGQFIHRTDDGARQLFGQDVPVLVDVLPVWHPDGDLYFVRTIIIDDEQTTGLYRIEAGDLRGNSDPELIPGALDWLGDEAFLALYDTEFTGLDGAVAFSPDGAQLALLVRPIGGVWIIDLGGGDPRQLVTTEQLNVGLPDYLANELFVPTALSWTSDGEEVIVSTLNINLTNATPNEMLYRVSVSTGEVTPVVDFSDAPDTASILETREDGTTRLFDQPRAAVMARRSPADDPTATQETLLIFNNEGFSSNAGLTIIALPSGDRISTDIIPYDRPPRPSFIYSVGTDGTTVRAILYGYLLTLEWEE